MASFDVTSLVNTTDIARLINKQIQSSASLQNEAGIKKASAQLKNDQLTIILQIQGSEAAATSKGQSQDTHLVEARVVYRIEDNQLIPDNEQTLSFYSKKALTKGELLAVSAERTDDTIQLKPKTLSHITPETQSQLNSLMAKISNPDELTESAQYFKPIMQVISALTQKSGLQQNTLQEIAAIIAQQTINKLPLEWLAEQPFQFNSQASLPEWLKNIPAMTLRSLHQQNMTLLSHALEKMQNEDGTFQLPVQKSDQLTALGASDLSEAIQTLKNKFVAKAYAQVQQTHISGFKIIQQLKTSPHDNVLSRQFLNPILQQTGSAHIDADGQNALFHQLQTWVQLQKRWIDSPETILNNPQHFLQMLPSSNSSSLLSIHTALEKLWPAYLKAGQQLSSLSQEIQTFQQLSKTGFDQNIIHKIMQLIQQEDELLELPHFKNQQINALALRAGISETIQSMLSQASSDDQQKMTLMTIPIQLSSEQSKGWMQVSAQTDRHIDEQNQTQISQVLTLDFETDKYGAIRFDLRFNEGFAIPICATDIWMEHASHIHFFQAYENQLMDRLARIGLSVQGVRWKQGKPAAEEISVRHQPKFQVDQYV
ncbi:MAG TPA: hypothetical protein DHW71_10770 [Gammaproteobacteria bacterium]|nr:hypothetical protein [Gammaproteobacteria bacterium]HBF09230.1 hypothetical protein [Gammaproteobacteria bacterium]HCK93464.1 hypothetical protein [Gammaproteobacteria bacterium]|tara:strand:+ start:28170 stop:29963 length:1794 start_codon:yes stop_codon:yes gene_type:complete